MKKTTKVKLSKMLKHCRAAFKSLSKARAIADNIGEDFYEDSEERNELSGIAAAYGETMNTIEILEALR